MAAQIEPTYVGDVVLAEWDQRLTRENAAQIDNDSGAAMDFPVGLVLEFDTNHYQPADGTTFGGILLENCGQVANSASVADKPILVRGPAIVNKSQLVWDADATQGDILAAMLALGIQVVEEPANTQTA